MDENVFCNVCYNTDSSENIFCKTPCKHDFCFKCLAKWFVTSQENLDELESAEGTTMCPMCRQLFLEHIPEAKYSEEEEEVDENNEPPPLTHQQQQQQIISNIIIPTFLTFSWFIMDNYMRRSILYFIIIIVLFMIE